MSEKKKKTTVTVVDEPREAVILDDSEFDRSVFEHTDGIDPQTIGFSPGADAVNPDNPKEANRATSFSDLDEQIGENGKKQKIRIRRKTRVIHDGGAGIRSMAVGIAYAVTVVVVGILAGILFISVANDVFAFVYEKDEAGEPVVHSFEIKEDNMSASQVADLLKEEGVIRYPLVFRLYSQLKKINTYSTENGRLKLGPCSISEAANYDAIIGALNPSEGRREVTITFSEGMTTDDILDLLLEKGIGTREKFVDVINHHEFDYWFMEYVNESYTEDRFYRLDGFLYPDTYRFYSDSSEVTAIDKMLANFNKKFGEEYKQACDEVGLRPDQVVVLASMIESEARHVSDYTKVSAVFHNRIRSATFNGRMESDATVQYYFRHFEGARHKTVTPEDLETVTPYNTYLTNGFPPGAICNPSLNSLKAALYPEEGWNYYYFVARYNGYLLYGKTYAEHQANIAKAQQEKDDIGGGIGDWED